MLSCRACIHEFRASEAAEKCRWTSIDADSSLLERRRSQRTWRGHRPSDRNQQELGRGIRHGCAINLLTRGLRFPERDSVRSIRRPHSADIRNKRLTHGMAPLWKRETACCGWGYPADMGITPETKSTGSSWLTMRPVGRRSTLPPVLIFQGRGRTGMFPTTRTGPPQAGIRITISSSLIRTAGYAGSERVHCGVREAQDQNRSITGTSGSASLVLTPARWTPSASPWSARNPWWSNTP